MGLKETLLKRIDVRGLLVEDVLEGVIYKKIDELVADSSNTLDDALAAMIKPEVTKAVEKAIADFLAEHGSAPAA